jgi:hypothetical protein
MGREPTMQVDDVILVSCGDHVVDEWRTRYEGTHAA